MTTLTKRLRDYINNTEDCALRKDAADEIEHLTKQRDELLSALMIISGANEGNCSTTPLVHIAKEAIARVKNAPQT